MSTEESDNILADSEILARFILFSSWVRADGTTRADAFFPPSDLNLSTTRRSGIEDAMMWLIGEAVAAARSTKLLGAADIVVGDVRATGLEAKADRLTENPNHALIVGWPPDKPTQKVLALQLAASSTFVPKPER